MRKLIDPQRTQIVISDIHGQWEALQRLKQKFGYNPKNHQLIYLGDYVDRGPNSSEVVNEVMEDVLENDAIALLGNHERMMLNAYAPNKDKINNMLLWLINGGQKTLDSYKKKGLKERHLEFLSTLPIIVQTDNYLLVHAGVNPKLKLEDQIEEDLLWIKDGFWDAPDLSRVTNKTVVFGHTPTVAFTGNDDIYMGWDRIGVDTGAGYNMRLSAFDLQRQCGYFVEVIN